MIIRRKFEEYMDRMAMKNDIEYVGLCIVNVPHSWYKFGIMGGTIYE